jgi:hypothetical protein
VWQRSLLAAEKLPDGESLVIMALMAVTPLVSRTWSVRGIMFHRLKMNSLTTFQTLLFGFPCFKLRPHKLKREPELKTARTGNIIITGEDLRTFPRPASSHSLPVPTDAISAPAAPYIDLRPCRPSDHPIQNCAVSRRAARTAYDMR